MYNPNKFNYVSIDRTTVNGSRRYATPDSKIVFKLFNWTKYSSYRRLTMYYVYLLINPNTGLPFYVGKGSGKRATYHITQNKRGVSTDNPHKDNTIRRLLSEDKEPVIDYIFWSENEEEAYQIEADTIKRYGRAEFDLGGILTNICLDNRPPHSNYSSERREKYRKAMMGNKINVGRVHSEDEKRQRSKTLKESYSSGKRKITEKMREQTRKTHLGKIVTDETKNKQSDIAKKRNVWKIGKSNEEIFGKKKADEIRKKKQGILPKNTIPVTIDGINYPSIKHAAIALSTTEYKIKKKYVN